MLFLVQQQPAAPQKANDIGQHHQLIEQVCQPPHQRRFGHRPGKEKGQRQQGVGQFSLLPEQIPGVELSEDDFDLTSQDADFEMGSYDYHEEGDMIIVDFDQTAADEDVSYEITDGQTLDEDGETVDLTEQDADFELSPYSYTEENGKITVDLSGTDLD